MWVRPFRLDVVHELVLAAPDFGLPKEAIAVTDALYRALSPKFSLSVSDFASTGGQKFSDVSVRVSLAGGNGTVYVTPEMYGVQFQWVRENDVDLLVECIALVEQAMLQVFPKAEFKLRRVASAYWLECEGKRDTAHAVLRKIAPLAKSVPARLAGGAVSVPRFSAAIDGEAQGFSARFDIEESAITSADIFLRLESSFLPKGAHFDIPNARAKNSELLLAMLGVMDLQPENVTKAAN